MSRTKYRLVIFLVSIFVIFGCFSSQNESRYTIVKLESIGNFNKIYALRNDSTFQIISRKVTANDCDQIKIKSKYQLELKSIIFTDDLNNEKITYMTNHYVKCVVLDKDVSACIEDNTVQDLFYTPNLEGLCYIKK